MAVLYPARRWFDKAAAARLVVELSVARIQPERGGIGFLERRVLTDFVEKVRCTPGYAVPDHSSFSKARHGRFRDSDAFRHVFETVVQRAMIEGLVGGEGFAVDASLIAADANK